MDAFQFDISLEHFEEHILPQCTDDDLTIVLCTGIHNTHFFINKAT